MTTLTAPDVAVATRGTGASRARRLAELLADPWRALGAAVVLLVAVVGLDALGDPDVWWHLRLGQWIVDNHRIPTTELFSYTAHGHPLLAHEWLSDTLFALLAGAGGLFLVALVMGAVAWSAMLATALRGRARGAGPLALALGLALGAKAAQPVLGTRPQVFTVALVCWTLWLAESYLRDGGRRRWLLPPLFLLWANLHAGFLAGLGILTLLLAVETLRRRLQPRAAIAADRLRGLAAAIGASVLAACVNPAGPLLYRFAVMTTATEGQKSIIEWQSPNFHDPGMWALLALLVTLAALPALGGRLDVRDAALAAAGTAMALLAVRNTAVCVVLVTPAWMAMAGEVGRRHVPLRTRARAGPIMVGATVIGTALLAVTYAGLRTQTAASSTGVAAAYPSCATTVLLRAPESQRVFTSYGTGGFVIDRLWPHASVYEYGESISLGTTVFADYLRIAAGAQTSPTAMQLLDASRTTAVLFPKSDLTAELDAAPGWLRVLDDHGMLLYVRGDASWAAGPACSSSAAHTG